MCKYEVCESPLSTKPLEFMLVLGIHLEPQANWKYKKHCKPVAHGMFNTVLYQLFVSNKTLLVWWDLSTYHPGQMSWPLKWSHSKRSWTGMCRQGSSTQTVSRRSRKCKVSKRQWSSASWMSCWCILDIVSELQTLKKSFCWFYLTILWYIRLYTYTSSVQ